jgi:hypothetical protein
MSDKLEIPESLSTQVVGIGSKVHAEDVDTYGKIREIEDKSHKLRTVLDAWGTQQGEERELRKSYASKLIIALVVQLVIVDGVFIVMGAGGLTIPESVANTFIVSVFGEIAAMALIVTRYLFPKVGVEVLNLIEKL